MPIIIFGLYYKVAPAMGTFFWYHPCFPPFTSFSSPFTGFGLYDCSFIQTLRDLSDPTPFIRGIVAELGPELGKLEGQTQQSALTEQ